MIALIAAALIGLSAPANGSHKPLGWNCDTHTGMADSMGLDGYRLIKRKRLNRRMSVDIWKSIVPPEDRPPGRPDYIQVKHSATEDCVIPDRGK